MRINSIFRLIMFNFDINDLVAFRAVADLGNFRRAATSMHISQPAFSRRIEKLEQALGVRLLERTTRHVSLTAAGRDFARKVRHLLGELDNALLGTRGVAASRMSEVTIACIPSTVNYFLSSVILRFHEQRPKVRVRFLDEGAGDVLTAVARSDADFGITFMGTQEIDLEFQPLFEERFVAACRHDHPLAKKKQIKWSDLAEYDYISIGKKSGNRLLLDQTLAGVAEKPLSVYETQHGSTMLGLAAAGLGVAVVPSISLPDKHPLLVSIPLTDPTVARKIGLIRRRHNVLHPSAQRLYDLCMEMAPYNGKRRTGKS
jgi:DNA-binding transcriptional LysR family regulator